ncbi:endolytic transglycosylase MltG [Senegalimassilia anaerobia]
MSPRRQVTYSRRPNHAARSAHARGDRLFRTYDTSYIQPKRSNVPHYVFLAVLALLGIGILWFVGSSVASCVSPKVELLAEGQQATITVNEGASANTVGSALVDAKLVGSSKEFTERVKDLDVGSDLKPGTYTFAGGATVDDIISALCNGPVSDAVLTIPEGYRLTEIASAVESATSGRISADSFKQAASDASVYAGDYGFLKSAGTNSLEGFLFPKTYDVAADATADSLIRAMLTQFQTETAGLDWSYPESQGLSVHDTVNLASIVEKESSGDETVRAQVAAVFYNRLTTKGEPSNGYLQSDATTAYEVGHDPSADEVHANSPYSTYTNAGLPPTPICSPSLECLQAVCSPNKDALGKYYFFYFQNDKYTFSETYDEHQAAFS